ncbi:MAG: hypothetical protein ABI432_02555 [Flavobacteriales bacterium]
MSTIPRLLHCDGRTDRLTYQRNVALLTAAKLAADSVVLYVSAPKPSMGLAAYGWLNPFALIDPWLDREVPTLICATTFLFFTALVWNSVHRTRDTGYPHWLGLLSAVPFANVAVTLFLSFAARERRSVFDLN